MGNNNNLHSRLHWEWDWHEDEVRERFIVWHVYIQRVSVLQIHGEKVDSSPDIPVSIEISSSFLLSLFITLFLHFDAFPLKYPACILSFTLQSMYRCLCASIDTFTRKSIHECTKLKRNQTRGRDDEHYEQTITSSFHVFLAFGFRLFNSYSKFNNQVEFK